MAYFGCGTGVVIGGPIAEAPVDVETAEIGGTQAWVGGVLFGGTPLLGFFGWSREGRRTRRDGVRSNRGVHWVL